MEKVKFTISFVKKLVPGKAERYADTETQGLQIKVSKTKVTYLFSKRHNYKLYEFVLGAHPDIMLEEARTMALEKLAALANYDDVSSPVVRKQPTVKEAIALWLETQRDKAKAISSIKCFTRLENKKIAELIPADVERIFYGMKNTPSAANHAVRYLKCAINKIYKKIKAENPVPFLFDGIVKYPQKARYRVMTESEAPQIINKLIEYTKKGMYSEQAKAILLMIYTGQRRSRVLGISVEQLDVDLKLWHVPGNDIKRPVELPLNEFAWSIIAEQMTARPKGHLFLWRGKPMKDCRKTLRAVCRECGIENLHLHDLRRSLGTWMLSSGASIEMVSKTLGHSSIRVTEQVYAHLLGSRGREATTTAIDAMLKGKV